MSPDTLTLTHVRALFATLHAMYGNAATERFRMGQLGADGADVGVTNAQRQWLTVLAEFGALVVRAAVQRAAQQHKTFPPTLPEFVDLCRVVRRGLPQPVAKPQALLGVSAEYRSQHVQRVRKMLAEAKARRAGEVTTPMQAGMHTLLALCAHAAGLAGEDEGAVLLKLEAQHRDGR